MTQIITRYFDKAEQAIKAREELIQFNRFSPRIIDVYDSADGLATNLDANHVAPETAKAYEAKMSSGGAVMLVHAGYKPLRVAQITRDVTAAFGAVDMGDLQEEVTVKDPPKLGVSILSDHPHVFLKRHRPGQTNFHMADWPIPLISRRKPFTETWFPRHAHMANFPIPLIDRRKPYTGSIFPRHARMANFPIPLISRRKPFTGSIFAPHARMANFPIPLISRRKPFNRSIIPRHGRMATVPFPLLINGETGKNALIPGGPHMANFPISLLSDRKPYTKSIVGRHARMANFPLPLISRRKPFTGSAFPPHARMANMFLPLTIRRRDTAAENGGTGFSFSKLLGLPTVIRKSRG